MKIKLVIIASLLLTLFVATVSAPWATLSSGYAIWTNYHGVDIPAGTEVTATAGTTEHPDSSAHNKLPNVTAVRFRWMPPGAPDIYSPDLSDPPMLLEWDGTTYYDGWKVYMANDTQTLNVLGDWGVQAWFYDTEGDNPRLRNETDIEKIRAVSVNTVPDIPVVGTAGAAAAMLLGLGFYLSKKKKQF